MIPITDVQTMRERDAATIADGTAGRELMRRAATGMLNACEWRGRIGILCGSGNNAGDGYALAELLAARGQDVTLFRLGEQLSLDGKYYFDRCLAGGVPVMQYTEDVDLKAYDMLVDCIFGTGFRGTPTGVAAHAIQAINASSAYVVSADINSGLNGDNGQGDACVCSSLTVSIGTYKAGLFLGRAKDVVGEKTNVDIGIEMPAPSVLLAEAGDFKHILRPRPHTSHKGNYGYVTVMGGSREYAGAAKLANMSASALRTGCGVAQLAVPDAIADAVAPYLLESTLLPVPSNEGGHMCYCPALLDTLLSRQAAIAVGMGWGSAEAHAEILEHLLSKGNIPLLIDADGLNTLSRMDKEILKKTACRVVLTPHLKEFERLSGRTIAQILSDPIGCARAFAREYGVILLLKGACTVVTDGTRTLLVDRGCAGMATAGSGDVLSGILAGLLGYNEATVDTVACGAYIAGVAGELAAPLVNPISMIASDTVAHIADAVSRML